MPSAAISSIFQRLAQKAGKHTIAVRVVDIFGNDATATMGIKV